MSLGKITIVEDEGLVADYTASILKKAGYVISGIAASAEEFFESLRASIPDLVLMDIRIHGTLDGIQTAAKLREDDDVPVIFLSAYSDSQTMGRAQQIGSSGFLSKPVNRMILLKAVDAAIHKHRIETH